MITVHYESTTMYTLFALGYTITRITYDGMAVMTPDGTHAQQGGAA